MFERATSGTAAARSGGVPSGLPEVHGRLRLSERRATPLLLLTLLFVDFCTTQIGSETAKAIQFSKFAECYWAKRKTEARFWWGSLRRAEPEACRNWSGSRASTPTPSPGRWPRGCRPCRTGEVARAACCQAQQMKVGNGVEHRQGVESQDQHSCFASLEGGTF